MSSNISVNSNLIVPETYDENASTEAIETSIAATLPVIPGLESALSAAERCAVLATAAAHSRSAFIARFGSAFDCEAPAKTLPDSIPLAWSFSKQPTVAAA